MIRPQLICAIRLHCRVHFCDDFAKRSLSQSGCFSPPTGTVTPHWYSGTTTLVAPQRHHHHMTEISICFAYCPLPVVAEKDSTRLDFVSMELNYFSFKQGPYFNVIISDQPSPLAFHPVTTFTLDHPYYYIYQVFPFHKIL